MDTHRFGGKANPLGSSSPTPILTWLLLAWLEPPRKGRRGLECSGATRIPLTLRRRARPVAKEKVLAHYHRIKISPPVRRSPEPVTRAKSKRRGAMALCPVRGARGCRFRASTTQLTRGACHQILCLHLETILGVGLPTLVVCSATLMPEVVVQGSCL